MKNNNQFAELRQKLYLSAIVAICICVLPAICLGKQTASITEVLENSVFKKEVTITNGPSVYPDIIGLIHEPEAVDNPLSAAKIGQDFGFAWKVGAVSEKDAKKHKSKIGSSVLAFLHEVALSRNEILVEVDAGIVAVPIQTPIIRRSFQTFPQNPDPALGELSQLVFPKPIRLIEQDALEVARLFGSNIVETNQLRKNSPPFRAELTMDEPAKQSVKSINVIGSWTYEGFLDVICVLAELRWHIDGNKFVIHRQP